MFISHLLKMALGEIGVRIVKSQYQQAKLSYLLLMLRIYRLNLVVICISMYLRLKEHQGLISTYLVLLVSFYLAFFILNHLID